MTDVQLSAVDEEILDTVLAPDVEFDGTLMFKKPLMIKGRFSGEIKASGDLYIDEKAEVKADIKAGLVSVKGKVVGDVNAYSRIELFATCALQGNISAPEIAMENGCRFNGVCATTPGKKDEQPR
jgi:cytoskeletal protein CcmA (bactofilin family)